MSKQIQALKAEIILVLTDPDNILSHGARKSLCYVSQGLEALAADVPQVAFGNKAEQTAQRDHSQDGPDCEDGPDEEGFRGPRPWNGFDTTTPQAQPAPEIAIADAYRAGVDSGIAAEREACEMAIEELPPDADRGDCAAAIRARGNT